MNQPQHPPKQSAADEGGGSLLSLCLRKCEAGDEEAVAASGEGGGYRRRRSMFRITLFGVTQKGKTVCLRVTDFRPYFHVHLALPLTAERFTAFVSWLRAEICPPSWSAKRPRLGQQQQPPPPQEDEDMVATIDDEFRIEETYAGEGRRRCIRLEFVSEQLRGKALRFLRGPDAHPPCLIRPTRPPAPAIPGLEERGAAAERRARGYETYGGKMKSLHAFMHKAQLRPSGWITARLVGPRVRDGWSVGCHAEYEVLSRHLRADLARIDAVPMLAASFDCEMDSSHGDFPLPVKDYSRPATQIVEMCARHVHGATADAATRFLRRALEHMFPAPPGTPAAAVAKEEEEGERLPIDCVYPKQSPFGDSADARAAWIEATTALFARRPVAHLLAGGKMRDVAQTLRVAALFAQQQQREEEEEENENEGGDEGGGGDADHGDEAPPPPSNFQGGGSTPVEELLQKEGLAPGSVTFVDVLRAHLDTSEVAKKARAAPPPRAGMDAFLEKKEQQQPPQHKKKAAAAEAPPVVLSQHHKQQLLNQLLTLCLPPLLGDPVAMVGTVFEWQGGGEAAAQESHVVVVGSCAPTPGVTVHSVPDERSLLLAWAALMRAKQPWVVYSFNGFGFDFKYMFLRAQELGVADQVFAFSRRRDWSGLVYDWRTKTESLAVNQGDYLMERPDLPGVIQIDLLFYFRREHSDYRSYALDAIASKNLNDGVWAMDTVAAADVLRAAAAGGDGDARDGKDYRLELLDWDDPLTVRPRGDRLLRLETKDLSGLVLGNYVSLKILDGKIADSFLTQASWEEGGNGDARHKVQVLGIEHIGERRLLLVDAEVADAVRRQVAAAAAEEREMLGEAPAPPDGGLERAPAPGGGLAAAARPVPRLGAGLCWCLVKDDVPYREMFRMIRGSAVDRAVVAKYCVGDCQLPLVLAAKLAVLPWYMETASLCCVDVSTLVFNGQGAMLHSYVGNACFANRTLLRDLENEVVAYDGATVLEPRRQAYADQPVTVDDFSSLYPSLMAGYNFSPGTRVWACYYRLGSVPGPKAGGPNLTFWEGGGLGPLFAYEGVLRSAADRRPGESPFLYHGLPGREYGYTWYTLKVRVPAPKGGKATSVAVGNKLVCWMAPAFADATHSPVTHPAAAGVYPQQALGLLAARGEKKKLQKQPGLDPFVRGVYKLQELAVKKNNNSVYGQMGSTTSPLRDLDVAASICSAGRLHILYTKTLVERVYADRVVRVAPFGAMRTRSCYVYGDTDSVFFCFNLETVDPAAYPDAFVPVARTGWTGRPRPIRGRVALQCSIVLGTRVAALVTATGPPPMALAFEKVLMNFCIVSKKKYAGILYENDPDKGKLKYMGMQVKKRDSCDCVRDVFGTILARMMRDARKVGPMVRYLTAVVRAITEEGRLPVNKFLITKTLKSGYTNPASVPHNVLADRIEQRAPGTRPKPGDRVTYAFVVPEKGVVGLGAKGKIVKGQCIDTAEHILSAGLRIDYEEYVRVHVMQPVVQVLSLLVVDIVGQLGSPADRAELADVLAAAAAAGDDLVLRNKIVESGGKRLVTRIVFEPFLRELASKNQALQLREQGLCDIAGFFGGGGRGGDRGERTAAPLLPMLGPTIKSRPSSSTAGGGSSAKGGAATTTSLQKTMKQFFQLGGGGRKA